MRAFFGHEPALLKHRGCIGQAAGRWRFGRILEWASIEWDGNSLKNSCIERERQVGHTATIAAASRTASSAALCRACGSCSGWKAHAARRAPLLET